MELSSREHSSEEEKPSDPQSLTSPDDENLETLSPVPVSKSLSRPNLRPLRELEEAFGELGLEGPPKVVTRAFGHRAFKAGNEPSPLSPNLDKSLDQIEAHNAGQGYFPQTNENVEGQEVETQEFEMQDSPPTQREQPKARRPLREAQGKAEPPPQTRVTKTGKVQELVTLSSPKVPDPIR